MEKTTCMPMKQSRVVGSDRPGSSQQGRERESTTMTDRGAIVVCLYLADKLKSSGDLMAHDDRQVASVRVARHSDQTTQRDCVNYVTMNERKANFAAKAGSMKWKLDDIVCITSSAHRLTDDLKNISTKLAKLSEVDEPSLNMNYWMKDVRELSYDMEDCVDQFLHTEDPDAKIAWINNLLGFEIRVEEARERYDRYKLESGINDPITTVRHCFRRVYGEPRRVVPVGLETPTNELQFAGLWSPRTMLKTICILRLYPCLVLKELIAKKPDMRMILRSILSQIHLQRQPESYQVTNLIHDIRKHLQDKRYLIIIDGLWSVPVWDVLSRCFPEGNHCSRIMITTTIEDFLAVEKDFLNNSVIFRKTLQENVVPLYALVNPPVRTYLIVLDDLWRMEDWEVIESCFPRDNLHSRIIISTRNDALALRCCSALTDCIYKIGLLCDADSKQLFLNEVFSTGHSCADNLENVSAQILKKCGGLPLAIVTAASKLKHCEPERSWSEIGLNISSSACSRLILSYNDLPTNLKSCILYLSIFPEYYEISVERLTRLWIAEGFIIKENIRALEETAGSYLDGLISRNMVLPLHVNHHGIPKYRMVHPVIHDFIVQKAMEEKFIAILNDQHQDVANNYGSIPWLSMQRSSKQDQNVAQDGSMDLSHVRSIIVIGQANTVPRFADLSLVRILDLEGFDGMAAFLHGLHKLLLLRYLSLRGTDVRELPKAIEEPRFLQTLDVRYTNVKMLPLGIVRLERLTHLLGGRAQLPHEISKMNGLRTLSCDFAIERYTGIGAISELMNLMELELFCDFTQIPRAEKHVTFPHGGFQSLKKLRIRCNSASVTFEPKMLPMVKELELCFEGILDEEPIGVSGIEHLLSLKHVLLEFEQQNESTMAIVDAVREAASAVHPNHPEVTVNEPHSLHLSRYRSMDIVRGALPTVLSKLGKLLVNEYNLQTGLKGEIMFLEAELQSMKIALEKISGKPADEIDSQDKNWASEARELSYDIEDSVDTYLVHDKSSEMAALQGFAKLKERSLDLLTGFHFRHNLGTEIRGLKRRVMEASERHARYRIDNDTARRVTIDTRVLARYKDITELIGMDEERDAVIKILMHGDNEVSEQQDKIVSIFGFGGIGKTTLANMVYEKIKPQFECSAFVTVSQTPDMDKLFEDMFLQLSHKTNATINTIREFLMDKSCALPKNNCGYRIITTTRISRVAEQVGGAYRMKPLSLHNSRKLLYRRIFGSENEGNNEETGICPDEEVAGVLEKILKKCAGVPLAIITIASLLASKGTNKMEWYEVCNSIGSGLEDGQDVDNMRKILSFSYYGMPYHLRTCLLYLCVFPEDHKISKAQLIRMWIAEGFIIKCRPQGGIHSLFELGESYFNELVNRSVIQPICEEYSGGLVDYCRIHDMMLDLICSISSQENFVTIFNNGEYHTSPSRKVRRVSIRSNKFDCATLEATSMNITQVRSVVVFPACNSNMIMHQETNVNMLPALPSFGALRVLELQCHEDYSDYELKLLGYLFHLRYLGLRFGSLKTLPEEIGNLRFLQTLDVGCFGNLQFLQTLDVGCFGKSFASLYFLPSTVYQLRQLKSLNCSCYTVLINEIGSLTSLEALSVTATCSSTDAIMEGLGRLTELRVLSITLYIEWNERWEKSFVECLSKLKKLRSISMWLGCYYYDLNLDGWVTPRYLCKLDTFINTSADGFLPKLPAWIMKHYSLLVDLSVISIQVKELQREDLEGLGRLPALRVLHLKVYPKGYAIIGGFAFGTGSFRCLVQYKLLYANIGAVVFQSGAMPKLTRLEFRCPVRETREMAGGDGGFDLGLGNLPSLQHVEVDMENEGASEEEAMETKAALLHAVEIHPNHPTLKMYGGIGGFVEGVAATLLSLAVLFSSSGRLTPNLNFFSFFLGSSISADYGWLKVHEDGCLSRFRFRSTTGCTQKKKKLRITKFATLLERDVYLLENCRLHYNTSGR
ncbi:hypothetical protein U9M48_001812 [Paspalum notatum var. saurae]|uniref:Disease resistance protein RPM1 n=1 Tax=Paspalum notatum var. saurae TaxID=547442 RepID=A0AAQ3PIM7_PASNO